MEPDILERIVDGREEPRDLPLTLLKNITENFSEDRVVGQGGFGTVYKGVLRNGEVAVKRIRNNHSIDEKLFYREVECLLKISHKNIVRFLGFCSRTEHTAIEIEGSREHVYAEIRERLLCFEYISNGSLENYITDELRGLEWDTRYQIIRGICEGLHHLHKEKHILHMDLRPANILLDNLMVPKIIDFGLSRPNEDSQTTSEDRFGSLYCSPEYRRSGKMSVKSDVYSLGIIITELVTGEKGIPDKNNVLRRWRHRWRKSGKETPLVYQQVAKCMEIGLLCQEIEPYKRPFIWDVIHDMREMDNVDGTISSACEYIGQISPYSDHQMLGIEPLELHFRFELNKHILSSVELTNEDDTYIAFNIRNTSSMKFFIEPKRGIVPPQSKCSVEIILRAQEKAPQYMQQAFAFILQSTLVKDRLKAEDINAAIFNENLHDVVDEVSLDVVLDAQQQDQLLDIHKPKLPFPIEFHNKIPIVLTLEHLKAITCDFSPKSELGRGGYGVVYKGVFVGGEIIAVKKLSDIHIINDDQFRDEVNHLSGIRHKNVVQVLGYCAETSLEQRPQPTGRPIWVEMPKRLICFEYVPNKSLSMYISDESSGLDWKMRYEIIKGICSGLHFLHEDCRIVHLDLKPENILMDAAMVPKIADFGLSKIFTDQQTRLTVTDKRAGSLGYMAPEYNLYGMVSFGADIFSLGVIIIQIVTGHKEYPLSCSYFKLFDENHSPQSTETSIQEYTDNVVESWRKIFASTPKFKSMEKHTEQVKQCITIALNCVDTDKQKRPTAKDIIQVLTTIDQVTPESSALLDVHPLELHFRFEPNKLITCSLYLTNNTDEQVAFGLVKKTNEHDCFLKSLPLHGIVEPGITCTLVVIMNKQENLPQERNVDLILQTSTYYEGLNYREELGDTVHKVTLKGVCALQGETIFESIPSSIKILSMEDNLLINNSIFRMDVNQTEPLITTCHVSGHVLIWNYETQKSVGSIRIQYNLPAYSVKLIARKGWCLVGSSKGFIHVYNYKKEMQKITSFEADKRNVTSIAIHQTQRYVLSAGSEGIKLWDWDQDSFCWKCMQIFKEHSKLVFAIAFNPEDNNCFASASKDGTIKIWSLDSPKSMYTLYGHSDNVWSLDFFTRDGQQYLITGSVDKTAKIWDMQTRECVHTLPHTSQVSFVLSHPELPLLVTGTWSGDVYFWSSTNFRLKRIHKIDERSWVKGLACLNESGRVAVAHLDGVSVIEIRDEEEQGGSSSNNENSILARDS